MKSWTLSNSMKAVICSVNIQEIVSVGMFFHVGSQNETENTNGITHLLEHVLSDQFLDYCSRSGGRSNALTTKEYCCFFSKCSNRKIEPILKCFRRICDGIYSETDILRAKKMVINEMQDLDAEQSLDQQIFEVHLVGDPLRFLPIGKRENIERISANDIHSHFENYIQPSHCVLSIVGCIDENEGINIVERIFSDWYGTSKQTGQGHPVLPPQEKMHRLLISDSTTSSLRILFDGTGRASNNKAAYSLLCNFLGGGTHSQLFKHVRQKWSMAYNAFCVPQFFSHKGIIYLKIVGTADKSTVVIDKINELMLSLADQDIHPADIERCKMSLIEDHIFKHETLSSKMTLFGQQLLLEGRISTDKDIINAINQVEPEEIKIGLNHILSGNITMLLDPSAEIGRRYFNHIFI